MKRESFALPLAMVGVVALILGLAYADLRREQARALDDFTAEQTTLARMLAATLSSRIGAVARDLERASSLGAPALDALIAGNPAYRAIELLDAGGRPIARAGRARTDDKLLAQARAEVWSHALAGRGLHVSPPLGTRPRERLFVRRAADGGALIVAEVDRFFDGLREAAFSASPTPMRWIVMDGYDSWILHDQTADVRSASLRDNLLSPELQAMLEAMARGEAGTRFLSRDSAAALGLGERRAMAGFAPVALPDDRWSVAVIGSARHVRDRARLAGWRLAAAVTLTALLVGLFGLSSLRQERRRRALTQKLELAEATAALRERSEMLVESIPVGVMALDGDGRVRGVNPYLTERGARGEGTLAQALAGAELDAYADERAQLDALAEAARGERRVARRAGLTLHLGGQAREVDAWVVPLSRPLPDADCFVVLHDRTEQRILERSLQRAEKLATIGTLAAGVAHEVGTPLGIISGRAEQLLAKASDEPVRKGLSSILAQVDKVSTTIRQLLDFARTRPVRVEAVSPAQALAQATALLEHRFLQAGVALAVDAPPSLPPLAADRGQLEQVLVNLLVNACDACAKGGHVTARATSRDGKLLLDIVDDGCGIPAEQLGSVLDPFYTTKKRGQGTGLGLTIVADIVKNHGGSLALDSAVGRGTTVRIEWPAAPGAA